MGTAILVLQQDTPARAKQALSHIPIVMTAIRVCIPDLPHAQRLIEETEVLTGTAVDQAQPVAHSIMLPRRIHMKPDVAEQTTPLVAWIVRLLASG